MPFFETMTKTAILSPCRQYRYKLTRIWDDKLPMVTFVMLNPSSADAEKDDPTVKKCMAFARAWGRGGVVILNLFALRATGPSALLNMDDPVGPENDFHLAHLLPEDGLVIAAWGTMGSYMGRDKKVLSMFKEAGIVLHCLNVTMNGHPQHPLYIPNDTIPIPYGR